MSEKGTAKWTDVCAADDIKVGECIAAQVDGEPVIVIRTAAGCFALEDQCTHDGAELNDGEVDGDSIVCARHGARFCVRTGAVLEPPAYEAVAVFPVKVENGRVLVRDARWD